MELPVIPNRPEIIWDIAACIEFMDQADALISTPINTESGEEVAARIAEIITMYASSANVMASCKWYEQAAYKYEYHLHAKGLKERGRNNQFSELTAPSILKDYFKSRTAIFQALYIRAERTNSMLTHAMEGARSLLSRLKQEAYFAQVSSNLP